MVMQRQAITAEQFYEIAQQPEYDDRKVELVKGVIAEMSLPNPEHAEILALMSAKITTFVYANGLGKVLIGDAPFVLERNPAGKDTVRGIDIAYISKSKASGLFSRRALTVAPDIAVEIISPSNTAADIELKSQQLLAAGTELIWIVYPELRTVSVYTPEGAFTLRESDTLTAGDILPGFEIAVRDIFPS